MITDQFDHFQPPGLVWHCVPLHSELNLLITVASAVPELAPLAHSLRQSAFHSLFTYATGGEPASSVNGSTATDEAKAATTGKSDNEEEEGEEEEDAVVVDLSKTANTTEEHGEGKERRLLGRGPNSFSGRSGKLSNGGLGLGLTRAGSIPHGCNLFLWNFQMGKRTLERRWMSRKWKWRRTEQRMGAGAAQRRRWRSRPRRPVAEDAAARGVWRAQGSGECGVRHV